MAEAKVVHEEERRRFAVHEGKRTAILTYEREEGRIVYTHTIVPRELEGRGIGSALVRAGIDFARAEGLKVVPQCSFVRAWFERHEEERDLLA